MKDSELYYSVGGLLYCPANDTKIADKIINQRIPVPYSICFCLEDTIPDNAVADAELCLVQTLTRITKELGYNRFYLPNMFIRVRSIEQLFRIVDMLGQIAYDFIVGFNIPKFDDTNALDWINAMRKLNEGNTGLFLFSPILETERVVDMQNLYTIKSILSSVEELVLNIRVGANDLCNLFSVRRHSFETIYDILPVADILSNIIKVFGSDYVVTGPVWEYYNGEHWEKGFLKEICRDQACGFVGKTLIHPKQIPVYNQACAVLKEDRDDAKAILTWNDSKKLVSGSSVNSRMNERNVHTNWANKIMYLVDKYGVK